MARTVFLSLPLLLSVLLGAGPTLSVGQQLNSAAASRSHDSRAAALSQAQRDGEGCRRDLAELDSELESGRKSGTDASPQAATDKSRASMYEHLRESARILGDNGRLDACRMLAFEIRAMLDHDKLPMGGTNSP
jgi:hypothetical protein